MLATRPFRPWLRRLLDSPSLMLAVPLLVVVLVVLAAGSSFFARVDGWLQDSVHELVVPAQSFDDLLLIAIDDASLAELKPYLGAWPYPRSIYALLLDYLGEMQVRAVFFNILYADAREGDEAFAAALGRHPEVVLGAAAVRDSGRLEGAPNLPEGLLWLPSDFPVLPSMSWGAIALPAPMLHEGVGLPRVGVLSVEYDPDGVLRRVPLLHRINDGYLPSAVLAILLSDATPPVLAHADGKLVMNGTHWPVAEDGSVALLFPPNVEAVPLLPFSALVHAALGRPGYAIDPERLRGKTVFIGKTALFADRVTTPRGVMSGTQFWALAHGALRNGHILAPPSPAWNTVLLLSGMLPLGLVLVCRETSRRRWACVLGGAALACSVIFGLHLALAFGQQASWLALPLLVVFVTSLLTMYYLLHRRVRQAVAVEQESEQQRQLLGLVSHELKSPLAAIDLTLQNLARLEGVPPEIHMRHQRLHRASRRLQGLIDEYLNADRLAGSDPVAAGERLDLRAVVAEAVRLNVEMAGRPNIDTDVPSAPAMMRGDRKYMLTALCNLIDNAVKYSPPDAPISVELTDDARDWVLSVSDQGCGISEHDQPHIFEPYYRADGVQQPGNGLGLALVRQIVTAHGGKIGVSSAAGQGARFVMRIPMDGKS